MTQKLFTIFVDFKGGTYINQVSAENVNNAIEQWFEIFDFKYLEVEDTYISDIREDLQSNGFTPITNTKNVWCTTALLQDELVLFSLILTEQ